MTVPTTQNTKTYTGDGSTVAFSFPYLFYSTSHLVVKVDGVTKAINTDYTVTGAENPSGGTVTFNAAPSSSAAVVIQRIVPYTQDTDLEDFDGNPADVTEKQFDLLAMAGQQLSEQAARAILAPIGTTLTTNTITGTISTTPKVLTITTSGPATSDISSLAEALDVVITGAAEGDILTYDGDNWVNKTTLLGDYAFSGNLTFSGSVNTGAIAISGTSTEAAFITLAEDTDNGSNKVKLQAPASLGSDVTVTLPSLAGTLARTADIAAVSAPTYQYLTSGTGATYTTPAGCKAILVQMIGGGGGGGAHATNNGSNGGNTIFNSIEAAGGSGGGISGAAGVTGAAGGTGGSGSASLRRAGSAGYCTLGIASPSGSTVFGGGVRSNTTTSAGTSAAANTGVGGGGASANGLSQYSASSGGAGEYVEILITSPSASYTYTIGAGGNGGAAGTLAGGNGGSGFIKVTEYY